jgi:septum formation protein
MGLKFRVKPSDIDENIGEKNPRKLVRKLAVMKAREVAKSFPDSFVIGSDFMISVGGKLLGKPKSISDARRMLNLLSGKWHEGLCGIAVINTKTGREFSDVRTARVKMRRVSEREISAYLKTGWAMGRAGAYDILKALFMIEEVNGDFFAFQGISALALAKLLRKAGFEWENEIRLK